MNFMGLDSSPNRSTREVAPQVEKLLTAAREGSSAAFAKLQTLYSQPVYNTAIRITKNREDAEDAVQDTFLRAFLSLHSFEGRSSFYSWLTRIGINSALMILRKRRVRAEVSFDLSPDHSDQQVEVKDSSPGPEEICNQRQHCARILHAIRTLDPGLRAPILLQATHEYSLKEIARELEITEAAVKARLYRARVRLNSRLLSSHKDQRQSALQSSMRKTA